MRIPLQARGAVLLFRNRRWHFWRFSENGPHSSSFEDENGSLCSGLRTESVVGVTPVEWGWRDGGLELLQRSVRIQVTIVNAAAMDKGAP